MRTITMTAAQTETYDGDDHGATSLMADLRAQAQALADKTGEPVEVHTVDGIVADAVTPSR